MNIAIISTFFQPSSVPNHILHLNCSLLIKEPFIFNKYSLLFQNYLLPHLISIKFGIESISFFHRFFVEKFQYAVKDMQALNIKQSSNVYETVVVNLLHKKKEKFWTEGWVWWKLLVYGNVKMMVVKGNQLIQ